MLSAEDRRAYAGLQAASSVVVTKQLATRPVPAFGLPAHLRPSALADLPSLFAPAIESAFGRVARVSSAALLYSANKNAPEPALALLREDEQRLLENLHGARYPHRATDRSCPHCNLLRSLLCWPGKLPPVVTLNHGAHIEVTINPVTQTAKAQIKDFQVLVPECVATEYLRLAHPMHWQESPGSIFLESTASDQDGSPLLPGEPPEVVEAEWERRARTEGYLLEHVDWPLSPDVSASAVNVIAVRDFFNEVARSDVRTLRYNYALERSVQSNFAVTWEPGGLDIDGGRFEAVAIPVARLSDQNNYEFAWHQRDLLEASALTNAADLERLYSGNLPRWEGADPRDPEAAQPSKTVAAIRALADVLTEQWRHLGPCHVLQITASKQLHFTVPVNEPIEVWELMTALAPHFLFAFLNQAVCLAPQVLAQKCITPFRQSDQETRPS